MYKINPFDSVLLFYHLFTLEHNSSLFLRSDTITQTLPFIIIEICNIFHFLFLWDTQLNTLKTVYKHLTQLSDNVKHFSYHLIKLDKESPKIKICVFAFISIFYASL